jgi:steroid delta-isomerase-like uncharacterized protein
MMTTTAQETARAARLRLVEDHCLAENNHDLDAIMATFNDEPFFGLNDLAISGRVAVQGLYAGFGFGEQGSFSDLHVEIANRYIGEESVVLEIFINGRHTGEWNGIPATNRTIQVPACAIFTFDSEGKLAGEKVYADFSLVLRQLGVLA